MLEQIFLESVILYMLIDEACLSSWFFCHLWNFFFLSIIPRWVFVIFCIFLLHLHFHIYVNLWSNSTVASLVCWLIPSFYLVCIHRDGLGESYDRDISFASALETFAGGHNDPISVAFGGKKDF